MNATDSRPNRPTRAGRERRKRQCHCRSGVHIHFSTNTQKQKRRPVPEYNLGLLPQLFPPTENDFASGCRRNKPSIEYANRLVIIGTQRGMLGLNAVALAKSFSVGGKSWGSASRLYSGTGRRFCFCVLVENWICTPLRQWHCRFRRSLRARVGRFGLESVAFILDYFGRRR